MNAPELPPPLPARPVLPPPLPRQRHRPQFDGRVGEFFGIWFVNLILSILTLGIYSAWAKVRTQRYFYANTRLAGVSFEYTADPIVILKGRLVAYAVVIALGLSSHFLPVLYLVLLVLLFFAMPAIIVLGLRFRARYSLWRGIGFRFDREVGEGYMPFLMWKLVASATFGLLSPLARQKQHEFVVEGHRYGSKRFRFVGELSVYFHQFLLAVGLGAAVVLGLAGLALVVSLVVQHMSDVSGAELFLYSVIAVFSGFYLALLVLMIFLQVRYANLLWNNAVLGPHRFESTLRAREVLWIYFSNALVVLLTLGLAVPWAMIRLARYRAEHWTLIACGDLDAFAVASERETGAAGAELVDALDGGFDIGL